MVMSAYGALVALNTLLARICTAAIAALLGVIVVTMLSSVIWRYGLNSPLAWSDDVSLISLVWMTLLGLVVGMRQGHLAVEGLVELLPSKLARMVNLAVYLAVLFVALLVLKFGFPFVTQGMARIVPSMDWLKQGYIYLALPVGFALIIPFCIENALKPFLNETTGAVRE